MALCPFAEHKLIPPGSNDPAIRPRVAILHVAVSRAPSLFDFFKNRSGGIESHFYVRWTGKIEQYRDTGFEADANLGANPFAVSIETAGFALGRWNRAQRKSIQRLLVWLNEVHGIPFRECPKWDGSGVGYHSQFPEWSPSVKSCPGPFRIKQFENWLVPWLRVKRGEPNHVQRFRIAVREALVRAEAEIPASRVAVHRMLDEIDAALKEGPKR